MAMVEASTLESFVARWLEVLSLLAFSRSEEFSQMEEGNAAGLREERELDTERYLAQ